MLKMMKYLLHTLSCLLLFAAGTCLAQTPGHTLRSGGIDRTYRLHLPEGLPNGAPHVVDGHIGLKGVTHVPARLAADVAFALRVADGETVAVATRFMSNRSGSPCPP